MSGLLFEETVKLLAWLGFEVSQASGASVSLARPSGALSAAPTELLEAYHAGQRHEVLVELGVSSRQCSLAQVALWGLLVLLVVAGFVLPSCFSTCFQHLAVTLSASGVGLCPTIRHPWSLQDSAYPA